LTNLSKFLVSISDSKKTLFGKNHFKDFCSICNKELKFGARRWHFERQHFDVYFEYTYRYKLIDPLEYKKALQLKKEVDEGRFVTNLYAKNQQL